MNALVAIAELNTFVDQVVNIPLGVTTALDFIIHINVLNVT